MSCIRFSASYFTGNWMSAPLCFQNCRGAMYNRREQQLLKRENSRINFVCLQMLGISQDGRRNHFVPFLLCSYYTALLGIVVLPIVHKAHVTFRLVSTSNFLRSIYSCRLLIYTFYMRMLRIYNNLK